MESEDLSRYEHKIEEPVYEKWIVKQHAGQVFWCIKYLFNLKEVCMALLKGAVKT